MASRPPPRRVLPVPRFAQPDDVSCGPTCLAQVLTYYGDLRPISSLTARIRRNRDGGTLAVHIAALALELGYQVRLYPFGVRVFDPTWWDCDGEELHDLLHARARRLVELGAPADEVESVEAWRDLIAAGGRVAFHEPTTQLVARVIDRGRPLIVGLNATWLYREIRHRPDDNQPDAFGGWPVGHFVVVCGYTGHGRHLHVRDPSEDAPEHLHPEGAHRGSYPVPGDRLIHAVLLGDLTRDAVMIEIWPRHRPPLSIRS